jgi:hypothetical protein
MIPTQKLQFNVILFSSMLLLRGNLFLPLPASTTMGSENQVIDSYEEGDVAEVSYLVWNSLGLFFGGLLPPKTLYFNTNGCYCSTLNTGLNAQPLQLVTVCGLFFHLDKNRINSLMD